MHKGYRKVRQKWKKLRNKFHKSTAIETPAARRHEAMELLIVRHAVAFERDRDRWANDASRPLSPAGVRRSQKAAAGLKEFCKTPDRLVTSPLHSCQADRTNSDRGGRVAASRSRSRTDSPGENAAAVLTLSAKDRSQRMALVGHQPDLSALLSACLLKDRRPLPVEIKKNAVACLAFDGRARSGHCRAQVACDTAAIAAGFGAMKIIAVTNIKGGVGKTTTAVNLSYLCAASCGPTLLWDLDPQGAATYTLRGDPSRTRLVQRNCSTANVTCLN